MSPVIKKSIWAIVILVGAIVDCRAFYHFMKQNFPFILKWYNLLLLALLVFFITYLSERRRQATVAVQALALDYGDDEIP